MSSLTVTFILTFHKFVSNLGIQTSQARRTMTRTTVLTLGWTTLTMTTWTSTRWRCTPPPCTTLKKVLTRGGLFAQNVKVDTAISASSTMKRWSQWWKVLQSFEPPPSENQPHFESPQSENQLSFELPPRGNQLFCRIWSLRRDERGDLCTPQAR